MKTTYIYILIGLGIILAARGLWFAFFKPSPQNQPVKPKTKFTVDLSAFANALQTQRLSGGGGTQTTTMSSQLSSGVKESTRNAIASVASQPQNLLNVIR